MMRTLFHITSDLAWQEALKQNVYTAASLNEEGFIHFSCPYQVLNTAELFFKNSQEKLVLLQISEEKLTSPLKYEGDSENKFPHLYGPLNLEAVLSAQAFQKKDGVYQFSEEYQMVGDHLIRSAHLGDEAEIANVHIHSWLQSYPEIVPDEILKKLSLSFFQRMNYWKRTLKDKGQKKIFVAESRLHGIIAFTSIEPARDIEFEGYGEITTLYCLDEYKGQRLGHGLFSRALEELKKLKYEKVYLWVLEDNPTLKTYLKWQGIRSGKQKTVEFGKPLVHTAIEWNIKKI